jgi:hypothetical protein
MIEPAMTPEQVRLLRHLFSDIVKTQCDCDLAKAVVCFRCETLSEIEQCFPGLFVQACIEAARWPL